MGMTVSQWLDLWAAENGGLSEDVMNGFGTNSLSSLIQATKGPFWMNSQLVQKLDQSPNNNVFSRHLHKVLRNAHRKSVFASYWANTLLTISTHGHIAENLLTNNTDDEFVLRMFRYATPTSITNNALLGLYTRHSDPLVRDRAKKLFKKANHWDDATFQRWLDSQPNGFSQSNLYSVRH
jgi:hypothetical protein